MALEDTKKGRAGMFGFFIGGNTGAGHKVLDLSTRPALRHLRL